MRPFIFLCVPLFVLVTACASEQRVQPSILDVLDQSEHQSPAESPIPTSSRDCPVGTVSMCVAETRAGLRSNCACVNNADAMNALRGTTRY